MKTFVASIVLLVSVLIVSTAAQSTAAKKLLGQEPYFVAVEGEAFMGWGVAEEEVGKSLRYGSPFFYVVFKNAATKQGYKNYDSVVFKIGKISLIYLTNRFHQQNQQTVIIAVAGILDQQDLEYSLLQEGTKLEDIGDPSKYPYKRNTRVPKKVKDELTDRLTGRHRNKSWRVEDFGPEVKLNQIMLLKLGNLYAAIQPLKTRSEPVFYSQMSDYARRIFEKTEKKKAQTGVKNGVYNHEGILTYRGGYWTADSSPSSPPRKNLAQKSDKSLKNFAKRKAMRAFLFLTMFNPRCLTPDV